MIKQIEVKENIINYAEVFEDLPLYIEKYVQEIDQYSEEIQDYFHNYSYFDLSNGLIGNCILLAELERLTGDDKYAHVIHNILKVGLNKSNLLSLNSPSLWSGYTGICLILNCVSNNGTRYKNILLQCEQLLADQIKLKLQQANSNLKSNNIQMNDYDIIEGFAGILPYVMCMTENKVFTQDLKEEMIQYLIDIATLKEIDGELQPSWLINSENQFLEDEKNAYPNGNFNLGHSHGITGVLNSLILITKHNPEIITLTYETIFKLTQWLINYSYREGDYVYWDKKMPLENYINFSNSIAKDSINFTWCYGDLMIVNAIWSAGDLMGNEEFKNYAMDQFYKYTEMLKKIDLTSPTFCHGISGVLYIITEMKKKSQDPIFNEIEEKLINKINTHYNPNNRFGFKDIERYNNEEFQFNKTGILTGTSGVYLVLLNQSNENTSYLQNIFIV